MYLGELLTSLKRRLADSLQEKQATAATAVWNLIQSAHSTRLTPILTNTLLNFHNLMMWTHHLYKTQTLL